MKDIKYQFLEQYVLSQSVRKNNPKSVIDKCIRIAYKDMLDGGRFYIPKENNEHIIEEFKKILEQNNYNNPRHIIDEILALFGTNEKLQISEQRYATRFGLAQKLVNMTFKYLFVFSDYTELDIDFKNCDCPLDSVILKQLNYSENVWTKLNKTQYENIQNKISKLLETNTLKVSYEIGNLAYDFLYW